MLEGASDADKSRTSFSCSCIDSVTAANKTSRRTGTDVSCAGSPDDARANNVAAGASTSRRFITLKRAAAEIVSLLPASFLLFETAAALVAVAPSE